jgi:hypothetical protein
MQQKNSNGNWATVGEVDARALGFQLPTYLPIHSLAGAGAGPLRFGSKVEGAGPPSAVALLPPGGEVVMPSDHDFVESDALSEKCFGSLLAGGTLEQKQWLVIRYVYL